MNIANNRFFKIALDRATKLAGKPGRIISLLAQLSVKIYNTKGSSLKLCLIAEGNADVYPRFAPTMEWDTAAGHAIIRASGKEVYQTGKTEPLQYNKTDLLNPWFIAE